MSFCTRILRVTLETLLLCLLFTPASAQYYQQGNKLIGADAVGAAYQGNSVCLSADGRTAMVGGYVDNFAAGAAWVYAFSAGGWSQQGSKLVGTGAVDPARQGVSVSLSADGNTAVVGGFFDNGNVGAAWIYTRTAGVWSQQGSKLVGTGASGNAVQGTSVAISGDGNTAIIAGYYDNARIGAAWVFTRSGGVWSQEGNKLVGSGSAGSSYQGQSVAISADGNTAIVGGTIDNNAVGATWVFTRSNGVWSQQGSKLLGNDVVDSAQQGTSVALSADGNVALVGGWTDNGGLGATWVFTRSGGVWTQQGGKLVGTGFSGLSGQGRGVTLSADGNTAVVGGPGDNSGVGAIWVFKRSGGAWSQQGDKLVGTGAVGNASQGYSVSMSADAGTIIEGAQHDDGSLGAAWVFTNIPRSFHILSIFDIPNDQGGQVRIKWTRSPQDAPGSIPEITSYSIWRKMSSGMNATSRGKRLPESIAPDDPKLFYASTTMDSSLLYYDYVTSVPAVQLSQYQTVVPTLEDSTASGTHRFNFLVGAHTADPTQYYVSPPDSGYSVDNLSPPAVAGLIATVHPGPSVQLVWNPNNAPDISHFDIYRFVSNGFTSGPGLKIGSSQLDSFTDTSPVVGMNNQYHVVAVDVHGNEGPPSDIVGEPIPTSVGLELHDPKIPQEYSLSQNYPNPFNPQTTIQYALVKSGHIALTILNVLGEEVARPVDCQQEAGYYSLPFDASALPSGIYFYKLTTDKFTDVKQMLLVK